MTRRERFALSVFIGFVAPDLVRGSFTMALAWVVTAVVLAAATVVALVDGAARRVCRAHGHTWEKDDDGVCHCTRCPARFEP
jgi:hypothetical protein